MSEAKASSKSTARRHHGQFGRVPTAIVGVIVMFLIAIAVNYIAKAVGGRWDLTENKVYTLSNGTRNILKRIDTPVAVRFYTNDSSDFMSPAEIAYSKRVEDLLNEYQKASGGKRAQHRRRGLRHPRRLAARPVPRDRQRDLPRHRRQLRRRDGGHPLPARPARDADGIVGLRRPDIDMRKPAVTQHVVGAGAC